MKNIHSLLLGSALLVAGIVHAADLAPGFDAKLAAEARPQAEKDRDPYRHPREVLEFLGIGDGMTVLELAAGGGWYTEVLSAAVGPDGNVVSQNAERYRERVGEAMAARAERLGNVRLVYSDFESLQLDQPADAAITALNLHDQYNNSPEAAQQFLGSAFRNIKPGAVFGVIDHEGVAGQDNKNLHRMVPADAIAALEEAGFVVEAVSDLLDNPQDDHTLNIRDDSLRFRTDRFLIRARKPE